MFGKNSFYDGGISRSLAVVWTKLSFSIRIVFFLFFFVIGTSAFTQVIRITDQTPKALISSNLEQLVDSGKLSTLAEAIHSTHFEKRKGSIPVFPNNITSAWFRFSVSNGSGSGTLFLNIAYPNLSRVSLYRLDSGATTAVLMGEEGTEVLHTPRVAGSPNLVFDLNLPPGSAQQYLLHVNS